MSNSPCAVIEKWLRIYYPQYTKEYHCEMGNLYVADERLATYYDKIAPGCAVFVRDAIAISNRGDAISRSGSYKLNTILLL